MKEPMTSCDACGKWTRISYGCDSCGAMIGECCWDAICAKCAGETEPK